jgi:two-component system NtrC family sensor kinase
MPKASVLVVADRPDIGARLVEQVLPVAGYQAHLADRTTPPPPVDAVLVDITGLLAAPLTGLRAQRRLGCQAPALLFAARLTESMAADLLPLGVRGFEMKPADDATLLSALDDLLEKTALERRQQEISRQLDATRQALDRRLNELNTLSRVGRAIAAQDDLEVMLTHIVEAGVYLTRAEEGALFLVDEESGELTLRAEKNIGEKRASTIRVPSSDSTATYVQRTGKPIMRGGPQEQEQLKVKTGYLVQALISVPIVVDGKTVGVLSVYNHGAATFEESDQTVLMSLADFVAIALGRVKTIARLQARAEGSAEALRKGLEHAKTMEDPIGALTGQVQVLLSGQLGPLTKEQTDALHRVRLGLVRLEEITDALCDLADELESKQDKTGSQ